MDQQRETDNLTDLVRLFVHNLALSDTLDHGLSGIAAFIATLRHRKKANNRVGSRNNIRAHYDLGNDLFSLFLDSTMTYSSAIFDSENQLRSPSELRAIFSTGMPACLNIPRYLFTDLL